MQHNTPTIGRAAFCLLAMAIALAAFLTAGTAPAAAAENACSTTVVHDEFRTNDTLQEQVSDRGSITSVTENTKIKVSEDAGFYRVTGNNPNAYCVRFVVQVGALAIPPTNIPNEVEATNSSHTATWEAVHNFSADESYTQVEFILPADTTAQWAPNKYRVKTLSWTSRSTRESAGLLQRAKAKVTGPELLDDNVHTIAPNESTTVTVRLVHPETGERIEDWHASYRTADSDWIRVPDSTDEPVYKRTAKDGNAIQFTFNDPKAEVKFTANPGPVQSIKQQVGWFTNGPSKIPDLFGFGTIVPGGIR